MNDEELRELERVATTLRDPAALDRLIVEQRRVGRGRFADLARAFDDLGSVQLPSLRRNRCRFRGALLRELGETWLDEVRDVFAVLDRFITEHLPRAFDVPVRFQWAGAPGAGRRMRVEPPEEDEAATDEYWERFSEPEPWQEHTDRSAGASVRDRLLKAVQWTINDKVFTIRRASGKERQVAFSFDPVEAAAIGRLEAEHEAERLAFLDRFLDGVTERARFFHTNHILEEELVEPIGLTGLHRDEIYVLLDVDHVRALWISFDRFYG
jgi:hypothetical protein